MAAHRRLLGGVGDLLGNAADRLEGCHVTAHTCLHVLLEDEPRRDQPAVAEHEREQPHDPRTVGSSVKTTWKIEMQFAHLKRMLRLSRLRLRGPAGCL